MFDKKVILLMLLLQSGFVFAEYHPDDAFDQFALALQDVAAQEVPVKKIPPKLPPRKPKEEPQVVTQPQKPVAPLAPPAPKAPTEGQLKVKKIELTREEEKKVQVIKPKPQQFVGGLEEKLEARRKAVQAGEESEEEDVSEYEDD